MSTNDPYYVVAVGDATLFFKHKKKYRLSYLKTKFQERIIACLNCGHPIELFPGLVLEAPDGTHWKPEIRVEFTPVNAKVETELSPVEPEEKSA